MHCEDNEIEGEKSESSSIADNAQHMVISGSVREKLPPSLNIKSSNLRILDVIGQGTS